MPHIDLELTPNVDEGTKTLALLRVGLLQPQIIVTLRLVMTRTVDGDDVAEAFDDALRPRIARAVTDMNNSGELVILKLPAGPTA